MARSLSSDYGRERKRHRYRRSSASERPYIRKEKRRRSSSATERSSRRKSSQPIKNTEEGHLIYKKRDVLNERYQIKRELGEGTFGKVVLCKDKAKNDKKVAVKIIRNVEKYRDAAKIEIKILNAIREKSENTGCVEIFDSFNHYGHMCIVFERLGKSVFEFLKDNGFTPFSLSEIQQMGDDLLEALKFLHGIRYTHTDLKPENLLFVDSEYESVYDRHRGMNVRHVLDPSIKVIDFGSATHEEEHHSRVVSTRHYRAPEVIGELGWSYPCDMWSVGCILFELYTGHTLFQTHDNREHLCMMEHILGELPTWFCRASDKRYFKNERLQYNDQGSSARYVRKYCKPLTRYNKNPDSDFHCAFLDLLGQLLQYKPEERPTASDALQHRFFDRTLSGRESRSCKSR